MLLNEGIPLRYYFGKVQADLAYSALIGLAVNLITLKVRYALPEMPLTIPAFLGTSISVLLSFKVSQSYDRWWEARKVWGAIVNDSRTFVLQLQSFVQAAGREQVRSIAYRQIAWCYALGRSLRDQEPLAQLEPYLNAEERETLLPHKNKPLALLQLHTASVAALHEGQQLELLGKVQLDNTLVRLCDFMGRAERIKSTVFPATYRYYLHFIIYLFVITLSIALRDVPIYFEIPLLVVISAGFFLLEKSALHLQDPFRNRPSDTPVTAIARTIDINIRQLLGETELPPPHAPDGFYLL